MKISCNGCFGNIKILVAIFFVGTFLVVPFLVGSFVNDKLLVPRVSCFSYKGGSFFISTEKQIQRIF
jgi:hypothetical protein